MSETNERAPERREATERRRPNGGTGKKRKILAGILCAIALVGGVRLAMTWGTVNTDDAFIDGRIYQITPRVAGHVVEVPVTDNQSVEAGQVLAVLDPVPYEVALAQARADLAGAEAKLASLEQGVPLERSRTGHNVAGAKAQLASLRSNLLQAEKEQAAAEQAVRSAAAQLEQARLDHERIAALRGRDVVAQSQLDNAATALASAEAAHAAAKDQAQAAAQSVASLRSDATRLKANISLAATGDEEADIKQREAEAQRAMVALAREQVRQAELNLGYTKITAPAAGHVTRKNVEPGRSVSAGQALMAVVPLSRSDLWITANFKETDLTDVRPGQRVEIEVDTYPDLTLEGTVESLMAGTGAAFSLFPPENATGNYVKVVQRIPVRIALPPAKEGDPVLRVGMSVVPTIHLD